LTTRCGIGRGVQIPTADMIRLSVSSVDSARATAGVRDEDDEPGDNRQADHGPDPCLPGPTTAPLHAARVIHRDLLRLVFGASASLPFPQRLDAPATSGLQGDERHWVRGGPQGNRRRIPSLGCPRRCSTADKGLSAMASLAATPSPTPGPLADPTVWIEWSELEDGHWRAVCQRGSEDVYEEPADRRARLHPLDAKTSRASNSGSRGRSWARSVIAPSLRSR